MINVECTIPMSDLSNLKLFATHPHPCSYLDEQEATTLFIDPQAHIDKKLYSQLSHMGFRRSGSHLYRPQCNSCTACISCRIPVDLFSQNRSQRRSVKHNSDLTISCKTNIDIDEHYNVYAKYIELRHSDGDMYPPSREQYTAFLTSEWGVTEFIEFRLNEQLIAVAVCDTLDDGLSAVYTFYDPAFEPRSLGKFAILVQIEQAQARGLPYLYLGYWIRNCSKMSYKTQYRPLDLLIDRRWMRVN